MSRVGEAVRRGARRRARAPGAALAAAGTWALAGAASAVVVATPSDLSAQEVGAGAVAQTYTFGSPDAAGLADFRLVTLPLAFSVPIGAYVEIGAATAFADGRATGTDGSTASLAGFTDTDLFLSLGLGRDRAALTLGFTAPSGATSLSLAEATVAGIVAAELLPFAITTWGSGGGAGGDLALAFEAGGWGLGLSGGYQAPRSYEPLDAEAFAYRPGAQMRARVAVDRRVGSASTLAVVVGVQRFEDDALDDSNLFRSGTRVDGSASLTFPVGIRGSGQLHAGAYLRDRGTLLLEAPALDGAGDSPGQQLLTAGGAFRLPLADRVVAVPSVDGRVFRTDDGVGQGWLASAGVGFEIRLAGASFGRHVLLSPHAAFRRGRAVVREDSESDVTGWEAGVTLRLAGGS